MLGLFDGEMTMETNELCDRTDPLPETVPCNPPDEVSSGEEVAAPGLCCPPVSLGGLQVGLEMLAAGALPRVADYWDDPFYAGAFTDSELSSALLQADPVAHLAGILCVKQALRKCEASFAVIALNQIAVGKDARGLPFLTIKTRKGVERLPHSVSFSRAGELVTAIVIAAPVAAVVALPSSPAPASTAAQAPVETPEEATAHAGNLEDHLLRVFDEILKCPCDLETDSDPGRGIQGSLFGRGHDFVEQCHPNTGFHQGRACGITSASPGQPIVCVPSRTPMQAWS